MTTLQLPADSYLYFPEDGQLVRPDSLWLVSNSAALVLERSGWRLGRRSLRSGGDPARGPAWRLTTALGRSLLLGPGQLLPSLRGWQQPADLRVGQPVAVPRVVPGPEVPVYELPKRDVELLACALAPCCELGPAQMRFSAGGEAAERFAALAKRVFGRGVRPLITGEHVLVEGVAVGSWLDEMGLADREPATRLLPTVMFGLSTRRVGQFLHQLWVSSGTCVLERGHAPLMRALVGSSALARQIQLLLLRLKINAVVMPHQSAGWLVYIGGKTDLEGFMRRVRLAGAGGERQQQVLRAYLAERPGATTRDLLPAETWDLLVDPARRRLGLSRDRLLVTLGMPPRSRTGPVRLNRRRAAQAGQLIRSEELLELGRSDIYWDTLVSVELLPDTELWPVELEDVGQVQLITFNFS